MRTSIPLNLLILAFFLSSLAAANAKPFLVQNDIYWRELNLDEVAKAVDRTKSVFGKKEFQALIEPISDSIELKHRRDVVSFLLEHPSVFESLEASIDQFHQTHEASFLHFLDPKSRLQFHVDPIMGTNGSSASQLGMQAFTTLLIAQGLAYEGYQAYVNAGVVANGAQRGWFRGFVGYNLIGQVGGIGIAVYFTTKNIIATLHNISLADQQILGLARAREQLAKIEDQVRQINELQPLLLGKSIRSRFIDISDSLNTRLSSSHSLLPSWTSLFSLNLYDSLFSVSAELETEASQLGRIDAFLSIVRLFREYERAHLPISLASIEQPGFGYQFEDLRNVIVESSVGNDFNLGISEPARHVVITGPHGCGKTTFMKSIAHAMVLGQSLLIVPARHAHFAPIDQISTYFNIGDNIVLGLSSFMAEHKRMGELQRISASSTHGNNILMLVDEPYAKTIQAVGESRVTAFVRSLLQNKHVSLVLATHFEEPSQIAAQTSTIKNLQPEIDSQLRPTYRIVPGAAQWWFEDAEKREQFIESFIMGR